MIGDTKVSEVADQPETIYHSGAMRCNMSKSGLAVIPIHAVGALPVFATREEAEADNEMYGQDKNEVGVLEAVSPTVQEATTDIS